MTKNKHSIQKVFLEIDTHSMQMANSIKNNMAMFIKNELVPILEKQFNLIENTDDQIIQIEKLELSIQINAEKNTSIFSNSSTKIEFKNQIEKEIDKTINELKSNSISSEENSIIFNTISSEEKQIKTLLYFMEYGAMPWWIGKNDEFNNLEKINTIELQKLNFKNSFRKLIQQRKIQERVINQFSNTTLAVVIASLSKTVINEEKIAKNSLLKLINNQSFEYKKSFWQAIFELLNEGKSISIVQLYHRYSSLFQSSKITFPVFIQNLKSLVLIDLDEDECFATYKNQLIQKKSEEKSRIKSRENDDEKQLDFEIKEPNSNFKEDQNLIELTSTSSQTESNQQNFSDEINTNSEASSYNFNENQYKSIYVENAGLIILHPFLKQLLKSCDLLSENNIIVNKELAAHILHYAATKRENDFEHTMLFEKFLCGIPLLQSIKREIKIEEKHKQNVEEMLLAVVQHWSVLKNTSIDVLRSEFLQREGKLDCSESNPKLTIERKTQDLLLEKIPWNINIVKIPWMEKLMYTQW
ncbi:contractile injection system tape measure protein [Flavobacterium sp.]|uniref:contractile injection system tape measure protein n=1 Tax=Flavobacterium sp. TaxID=239 RepID=UPI002B4AC5FF|nr:contractile injection system tape measure protein [Flavobacterium sp.]HLP65746.1 contractile injection system tape measure protein [Flavobacterium sp.]